MSYRLHYDVIWVHQRTGFLAVSWMCSLGEEQGAAAVSFLHAHSSRLQSGVHAISVLRVRWMGPRCTADQCCPSFLCSRWGSSRNCWRPRFQAWRETVGNGQPLALPVQGQLYICPSWAPSFLRCVPFWWFQRVSAICHSQAWSDAVAW